MEDQPSPRKLAGVGPIQNFTPPALGTQSVDNRSSRSAIKAELPGKLVFDDDSVFIRLGTQYVPDSFVQACTSQLEKNNETVRAVQILQELVAAADGKDPGELEAENDIRDEDGHRRKVKRREVQMYPHLEKLFRFIAGYGNDPTQYRRQFVTTKSTVLSAEKHTYGFPPSSPDFTLIDPVVDPNKPLWRHRVAFGEIKPSSNQGPVPKSKDTVLPIVSQCADYARLHMSARPFQLFSVGLLIFGSRFCVGIFDRDGITFSPILTLWKWEREREWKFNEMFVRAVRRLSCDLSPLELGQDPTITMLPDEDAMSNASQAAARQLGQETAQDFPTFPTYGITMGGNDNRRWCTVGPPIWNSLSFLGRGTSIWRVIEVKDGQLSGAVIVMKCAWRSGKRLGESVIYESVKGTHPGVATYLFGGDVRLSSGEVITVNSLRLRRAPQFQDMAQESPVLHRLFLSTHGRPLWEYRSEAELVKGLRAALRGHEFLYKQGILHRDISVGNILLSASFNPEPGYEGFLTDLELARIEAPTLTTSSTASIPVEPVRHPSGMYTQPTTRSHSKFTTVTVPRGAAMSGTVQFMAVEILHGYMEHIAITHGPHHDIESFIWVLCYSISRHMDELPKSYQLSSDQRERIHTFFASCFTRLDLGSIMNSRKSRRPLDLKYLIADLISGQMISLLDALNYQIALFHLPQNATPLAYDKTLALFDQMVRDVEKM